MSTLIPQIRKELRIYHGLLKNEETAAGVACFERIGPIHDQLANAEASIVSIQVEHLRELLSKSTGVSEAATLEAKDVISYADQRAKQMAITSAAQKAREDNEAAKVALATPPPVAPPVPATETKPADTQPA